MPHLDTATIEELADSRAIFQRGLRLYTTGAFQLREYQPHDQTYLYDVDGNYGDYTTSVRLNGTVSASCDCPYPGSGCKHIVAVLFDVLARQEEADREEQPVPETQEPYLSPEEIRQQALADRKKRADKEIFTIIAGDMLKGDHLLETPRGRQYQVTLHDPATGRGHCSCPDFLTNRLGTCKHLIHLAHHLGRQKGFRKRLQQERFPYVDIHWNSVTGRPALFHEQPPEKLGTLRDLLDELFDEDGGCRAADITSLVPHIKPLTAHKLVRIQEPVLDRLARAAMDRELEQAAATPLPDLSRLLKVTPYPYQEEGVRFALYRRAALIGDEMGLGKTLQAIILGVLKKEIFGFDRILVVTLASLKDQWQREIEKFSHERATVISGPAQQRRQQYEDDGGLFRITNYEAVLRDVTIISRFRPDLIILDEAQRIKNFETKTAEAVKRLPRQHALVLTGTPLENKLEDVYSIVQFLDPDLLSPLWQFAADHFLLSRHKKGQILGYRNLDRLHEKLKSLVIRRRKEEVLSELPDQVTNNYFVDLHQEQKEIHAGYAQSLLPLLNKKFLTPMDVQRIQMLLLKMRQVCDSTHLIDRETNISPKLQELESILDELVIQNNRKVVIFSEWTTMTFLIGRHLSRAKIPFVELSGKVPVKKRQALIDEFTANPDCKVFLSTDAGGTGLNLQAADSVINFELPWNPARLNQRIGRVNRIGQQSQCVNVINLISKCSIEERILTGIKLKSEVFDGVFDGTTSEVMFDRRKRQDMVNQLRRMMGEEEEPLVAEPVPARELPEDTPYYLNPEVLAEEEETAAPQPAASPAGEQRPGAEAAATPASGRERQPAAATAAQSPEKMEEVLNQGMSFISGLMEMATGQKIEATEEDGRLVTLDRNTGEVTLKFRLPGFST